MDPREEEEGGGAVEMDEASPEPASRPGSAGEAAREGDRERMEALSVGGVMCGMASG
jgi:hypothetical protein